MFLLGLFWKRATEGGRDRRRGVVGAAVLARPSSDWPDLPFMDRMGLVFLAAWRWRWSSRWLRPAKAASNLITMEGVSYKTPPSFNIGALGVILILIALYATYW